MPFWARSCVNCTVAMPRIHWASCIPDCYRQLRGFDRTAKNGTLKAVFAVECTKPLEMSALAHALDQCQQGQEGGGRAAEVRRTC